MLGIVCGDFSGLVEVVSPGEKVIVFNFGFRRTDLRLPDLGWNGKMMSFHKSSS